MYGSQEGGSNDLVNQRLVGELILEGFEVSHTKDEILFDDGEQESLEHKLKQKLGDLRKMALVTHRKDTNFPKKTITPAQCEKVLNDIESEVKSDAVSNFLQTFEVPSQNLIKQTNEALKNSILKRHNPDLKARVNRLLVSLYLVDDMSPNDPYVIIESTQQKETVVVIINLLHPHWSQLTHIQSIENFVRHCVYDGVAEWKAYFINGKIDSDTVKLIKDNLLRIPLNLGHTV